MRADKAVCPAVIRHPISDILKMWGAAYWHYYMRTVVL